MPSSRAAKSDWIPKKSEAAAEDGFQVDFDLLVSNINELNELAEDEEPTIVKKANGATFETSHKSIPLTLFANGMSLYEGPFRSFDEPLARKFCIDIMDGYFPSELQTAFPDGVAFRLVDKRAVHFQPNALNSVFNSKGYRLGSATVGQPANTQPIKNIDIQLTGNFNAIGFLNNN